MSVARNAKIFQGSPRNLTRLARALIEGELVAVPTETVYGLAGDALNVKACRAIFRAKGRPSNDPLIVHILSLRQLDLLAERNPAVDAVAKAFWPGPLTLVLPKKKGVPSIVTSGQSSVAVRCPAHPLFRRLLRLCGRPLAAPSANPFGYISPTTAEHVAAGLGRKIKYILDGGPCQIGLESTILDLRDPTRPQILRPGAISRESLQKILGVQVRQNNSSVSPKENAASPGLLGKHYSPKTLLSLHPRLRLTDAQAAPKDAFLFFKKPAGAISRSALPNTKWLSATGDLPEAARSLFSLLRELDREKWTNLHAERAPGKSALALAINDRLTRASAKR